MNEIRLKITDMTCEHCVRAVTKALEDVSGVEKAEVTLKPGTAVVHGAVIDNQKLVDVVKEEGYGAEVE